MSPATATEASRFPDWKRSANSYLAWALQLALIAETGILIDFLPADGIIRHFSPEEEGMMGQSVERLVERLLRLRVKGTVVRLQCSASTTPEILYVAVAQAVRVIIQARRETSGASAVSSAQQQTQTQQAAGGKSTSSPAQSALRTVGESPQLTLVVIMQDIERAPMRTLECVTEMLAHKFLSSPPSATLLVPGSGIDRIDLPSSFVFIATSTMAPTMSTISTLANQACELSLPCRLLNSILLRIPIVLPREAPPAAGEISPIEVKIPAATVKSVFVSHAIAKFARDVIVALRSHEYVYRGPHLGAHDSLMLALRINACMNSRHFVVPMDVELCIVEVLAHQLLIRTDRLPPSDAKLHPLAMARRLVSLVVEDLPVLR